jgi:hypothetical protein
MNGTQIDGCSHPKTQLARAANFHYLTMPIVP